jgi:hypothetical protein
MTARRATSVRVWPVLIVLLLANGWAWWASASTGDGAVVQPRLEPKIAEIRQKIIDGSAAGERFEIVVTDQSVSEGIAWFLEKHPNIPFSQPQVRIHPDGVEGSGVVTAFGLRTPVSGKAALGIENGRPVVTILWLRLAGLPAPGGILQAVQQEAEAQLSKSQNLPVEVTRLELREGEALIEGVYR